MYCNRSGSMWIINVINMTEFLECPMNNFNNSVNLLVEEVIVVHAFIDYLQNVYQVYY